MNLQSVLSAALFTTVTTLSLGVQAADADKAPPAAEMKADTGDIANKPHSHVQEKTGIPQTAPAAVPAGKKSAYQDMTKHFHPRDMK